MDSYVKNTKDRHLAVFCVLFSLFYLIPLALLERERHALILRLKERNDERV